MHNKALQLTQQYAAPLRSAAHRRSTELHRYTQTKVAVHVR